MRSSVGFKVLTEVSPVTPVAGSDRDAPVLIELAAVGDVPEDRIRLPITGRPGVQTASFVVEIMGKLLTVDNEGSLLKLRVVATGREGVGQTTTGNRIGNGNVHCLGSIDA